MRVLILVMLFVALVVPMPTLAAAVPCDESLFMAGGNIAREGVMLEVGYWQFSDLPYTVDYSIHRGKYTTHFLQVRRNGKLIGEALQINAEPPVWSVCRGGNGWKNYLLSNAKG